MLFRAVNTGEEYGSFQPRLFQYVTCSLIPTISCPAIVCFRFICWRSESAGGQLEHPSEVKSSTAATDVGLTLNELSGDAACDFRGTARRANKIASAGRSCIGTPPA